MNILPNNIGNDYIKNKLSTKDNFLIGRMGITELQVMYYYVNNLPIPQYIVNLLINNAGVYGDSINEFCVEYLDSVRKSDIHIYWGIEDFIHMQEDLFNKVYDNKVRLIENRAVEPFYFDNPWSYNLKGKKVLVIHPFSDTIKLQYDKREVLFDNKDILPEFELITYKSIQSIGNQGPHKNWVESLNTMKDDISKIEFDIALIGCGAYGMPLGTHIKTLLNKQAIYIGGGLQLLFGIKGNRWDNHDVISKLYNEYWVRPNNNEVPPKHTSVEGGCYW
jgi:hypothetical protein